MRSAVERRVSSVNGIARVGRADLGALAAAR
jgi:hypothetical protein